MSIVQNKKAFHLAWGIRTFGHRFAISTSFQRSGMVIVDMAAKISSKVRVITLDTGRLPEETHAMMDTVRKRYGIRVEVAMPDPFEVQAMVRQHGSNLFFQDPALRKLCCHVRKVRPMERKLLQFRSYAVGLRRLTSDSRNEIHKAERDSLGLIKLAPIADWTRQDIEDYTLRHDVPMHPLYMEGFTSIGCAPCTRRTLPGEEERAGRWWWEQEGDKECGLHVAPNGTIVPKLNVLIEEIVHSSNA